MKLDQLSARYHPDEDRILVRMNTSTDDELRVWLTRRLCLKLWPSLNAVVTDRVALAEGARDPSRAAAALSDGHTRQMLADFQRQESLQNADFKTPFRSQPKQLPLGADPLLVTEVCLRNLSDGRLELDFREKRPGTPKPRSFKVGLESNNLNGFLHLIDKALESSGWLGEGATDSRPATAPSAGDKPKYLN
jgi:hypothetical protein